MRVQFVGCGDAFGSGGRLNTCFHLTGQTTNVLIDCGASSVIGLKRCGIDRNAIDAIVISHFHADHFGGIPFLMLDAQFVSRRQRPLTIAGPQGLPERYRTVMEAAFPGSSGTAQRFPLTLTELTVGQTGAVGALRVTPFPAIHDERAGPCLSLRIEAEGRVITYSGDTEWTPALIDASRGADLFICEAYTRDKSVKSHMSLAVLEQQLAHIGAKRVVLTHMSESMLADVGTIARETAEDGKIISL